MTVPSFLLTPLVSGFNEAATDLFGTFETEAHTTIRTRRYRSAPPILSLSYNLSQAQFDVFDAWIENVLAASSVSFVFDWEGESRESTFEGDAIEVEVVPGMRYLVSFQLRFGGVRDLSGPDPYCIFLKFSKDRYVGPDVNAGELLLQLGTQAYEAPPSSGCPLPTRR